jgi:hypothetical protein
MRTTLLLLALLFSSGCVSTFVRDVRPDRTLEIVHISVLRRGCYAATAPGLSLTAEDRALSHEAGILGTAVGAAFGPAGAIAGASSGVLTEAVRAFDDKPDDLPCHQGPAEKQQ